MSDSEPLHCSFCGRSQEECQRLIAGPAGANICDKCVLVCVEILIGANETEHTPEAAPVQGEEKE